jgi:hypothetical protein
MNAVARWAIAVVIGLGALVAFVALVNSRDQSGIDQPRNAAAAGPGKPYRGEPVLSPALEQAVRRGNVVVLYRDEKPPAGTEQLVPPGGKALEQAGQAVVLEREPTLHTALAAVSEQKIQEADRPGELAGFVDYWLGGR